MRTARDIAIEWLEESMYRIQEDTQWLEDAFNDEESPRAKAARYARHRLRLLEQDLGRWIEAAKTDAELNDR